MLVAPTGAPHAQNLQCPDAYCRAQSIKTVSPPLRLCGVNRSQKFSVPHYVPLPTILARCVVVTLKKVADPGSSRGSVGSIFC